MPTTPIITLAKLAVAARRPDIIDDHDYADWVIETASGLVVDYCGHPEWETDASPVIPREVVRICYKVATRGLNNPDLEKSGVTGPLASTVTEEAAAGLELTDVEKENLDDFADGGDDGVAGLWTLTIGNGPLSDTTVYIPDDTGGDWMIPYGDSSTTSAFGT